MNKQAFLEETYNSAFKDELEKLAEQNSKLKKSLKVGGVLLAAGLTGFGAGKVIKRVMRNASLKNLKSSEDILNKVINIKSSLDSDKANFLLKNKIMRSGQSKVDKITNKTDSILDMI